MSPKQDRQQPGREENGRGGTTAQDKLFFPVSPLMLFPQTVAEFRVYLRQDGKYVLYTREKESFSEKHRQSLYNHGIQTVYVLQEQKDEYDSYVEKHLGTLLEDKGIPVNERSRMFLSASQTIFQELFEHRLPESIGKGFYERARKFVTDSLSFLSVEDSLKSLGKLISHSYNTFSHSVHVYTYTMVLLHTLGLPDDELQEFGLGALFHDVGKIRIPGNILHKPGKLSPEEWEIMKRHPLHGVAMCSMIQLSQQTVNCILFHHERLDGKGYPTGLTGDAIPLPVRAVTICDIYDALTTNRVYAKAMQPFDALSYMRDTMKDALDMGLYKRFILLLSGADIV